MQTFVYLTISVEKKQFSLAKVCVCFSLCSIYECNGNCACGPQCFNRVVQNGIQLRLQVFKTENRYLL